MQERVFVGFGFGPIQSGLFLFEAYRSGRFGRLVVAEVQPEVVRAVRENGGTYRVNVAGVAGIETLTVEGVEMLDPAVPADRRRLVQTIAEASEIATALPSVAFYEKGAQAVAGLLAEGLSGKGEAGGPPAVVYAAENHNHAARLLAEAVRRRLPESRVAGTKAQVQFLDTVIGKMSGVVDNAERIRRERLSPVTPGEPRAYLVEEFNRILISGIDLPGFRRGIEVFEEKPDLLPFEEAKLYGHNATHALLGFLAARRGLTSMAEIESHGDLYRLAREAFLEESGAALIRRRNGIDPLFTPEGYRRYADDLLERMMNPYLRDGVDRIIRDPLRKLGWDDRLLGTMRMALEEGITPERYALGAAAALERLEEESGYGIGLLAAAAAGTPPSVRDAVLALIAGAAERLDGLTK